MTENKNEDQQAERRALVRKTVGSLITDAYQELYRGFDNLEKQLEITPAEVVEALEQMGEEEIREHYAQWADIDIREDDADTDPMAVPDPHDASSYECMAIHRTPIGDTFTGWELLAHLKDFPRSFVDQTGGGTATLVIRKSETDVAITAGPGSYNWVDGNASTFFVGEFCWGRADYDNDGEWYPDDAPAEYLDPVNSGSFEELAQRIRTEYAKYNTEGPSAK